MKLILTTAAEKSDFDIDKLNIPATLVLSPKSPEQASVLKKLKEGQRLYPYITVKGFLGDRAGVFKDDPIDYSSPEAFLGEATLQFKISKNAANLSSKMTEQREGLDSVRFSYLAPPYLEITKVVELDPVEGEEPQIAVQGKMWRAADQRLEYLDPSDSGTPFGKGRFTIDDVYATFDGNYVYTKLSPYSAQIKETVDEQRNAFLRLQSVLKEQNANPGKVKKLNAAYKGTQSLLKAHAGDLYDVDLNKGYLYYISASGTWLMSFIPGLRKIDLHDRLRLVNYCKEKLELDPLSSEDQATLREMALSFGTLSMQDRFKLEKCIPMLAPLLSRTNKDDVEAYTEAQEKLKKLKPADGPLGKDDLPGLRAGVDLFPHQALLLASIKDSDRDMIDADPGAGKTLLIICDIIQKMKAGKCKRPLVLMPEPLLDSFAQEIRDFSEFNAWIFNTEATAGWKAGDYNQFLDDAKKAPPNTIFLTSYNWISREVARVESGQLHATNEKNDHDIPSMEYGYFNTFPRAEALLSMLGVDALYEDECHILKGTSNQAWAAATLQRAPICRGLTGTIMPGNPIDVTGPMASIHSGVFGTRAEFLEEYTENGNIHRYKDDAAKKIRAKLRNFGTLSVRRSAWAALLPKVKTEYHYVDLSPEQQKAYEAVLTGIMDEIKKDPKLSKLFEKAKKEKLFDATDGGVSMGNILKRFIPLDMFLNAPGAVKDWKDIMEGENAISPKAKDVAKIIKAHLADERNGKVLVFVQFVEGAKNLLENMPDEIKEVSGFYQGGMSGPLNRLKNPDDPLKVLFAVDHTLRMGHNIQSVNCIIHVDLTWLPGYISQREGRSIRPKQTRQVNVHYVLANNTAEMLKMARIISAEHIIAKANSSFEDDSNIELRTMNLNDMSTFRDKADLEPYMKRREQIQAHVEAEAVTQQSFYGTKILQRRGYTSVSEMLPDAGRIHTPSAGNFDGRPSIVDKLIEDTLNEMPTAPKKPRSAFKFHLQHSEPGKWSLISYVGNDAKGYLRQFGFDLVRENMYLEVRNRAEVQKVLDKIARDLTIANRDELDKWIPQVRVTQPGVPHGQQKDAVLDRKKLMADAKPEVEIQYATIDGAPLLFVDTAEEGSAEIEILKKHGFQPQPAFWSLDVTRGRLITFLSKLTTKHPDVKIGDWSKLKAQVSIAFKANDLLDQFDQFAVKERAENDLSA